MSVTQVITHGEKFDSCGCASKREWVSTDMEVKICEEVKKGCGFMLSVIFISIEMISG